MGKRHVDNSFSRVRLPPLPLGNNLTIENLDHRRRKCEMVFQNGQCMARDSSFGGTGYWDEFRKQAGSDRGHNKTSSVVISPAPSSKKLLNPPEFCLEKKFRIKTLNRSLLPAIGQRGMITRRWAKNGQWT